MATVSDNLQGRTVYRGTSHAPTRGTNDPSGYVQRGIKNQQFTPRYGEAALNPQRSGQQGGGQGVSTFGSDGQSDTRSGLAQQALRKQDPNAMGSATPGRGIGTPTPNLNIPDAPVAQVNALGQLQLPYNFKSNQNIINQQNAANQALAELTRGEQTQSIDYLRNIAKGADEFSVADMMGRNTSAGRGTAFSSAHAKSSQGRMEQFNTLMNQLASDRQNGANNNTIRQNEITSGLTDFLINELLNQGYTAAEKAGKWEISEKPGK